MDLVYALVLENGNYYIGRTSNLNQRLVHHRQGEASAWTRLHRMIRIHCVWEVDNDFMEDNKVKEYMLSFGIDHVRGGSYSQVELSASQRRVLENEMRTVRNACLNCGQLGHFQGQCTAQIRVQSNVEPQLAPQNQTARIQPRAFNNNNNRRRAYRRRYSESESDSDSSEYDNCFRCGRSGHWADECYANTNYRGRRIY
jgi:predicted GIY-YIG superfamily endonuclease